MNQVSKKAGLEPVHPQYMIGYDQQDEISLVDLWIALLKFKRVFLSAVVVLLVIGIVAATSLITTKYKLSTVMEIARYNRDFIESYSSNFIESPAATISRINILILPDLVKKIAPEGGIDLLNTVISNPKDTNLIIIENKIAKDNEAFFSKFQNRIGIAIIEAHRILLIKLNSDFRRKIDLEKSVLDSLSFNEYVSKYKAGIKNSILLLEDRINILLNDNLVIQSTANESKADNLTIMMQISANNRFITDMVNKKILLEQELSLSYEKFREEMMKKEQNIMILESKIQTGLTQISGNAELSLKPVGLSLTQGYAIVVFLSIFMAFAITLIAIFRSKVIERLATET
ncbi:MAG: hypothetical protein ACI88A_004355 [Paraglaciecola sp.]|jgi:hypothetical protein